MLRSRPSTHRNFVIICLWAMLTACAGAQDYSKTEITEIARDLRYTSGAAWSPAGFLLFSDVPNNRIYRYAPGGKVSIFRDAANGAAGNAFDKNGVLYTAETLSRRITRTQGTAITTLAAEWEGKRFSSPHGIALWRNGDIFFSDPAYASALKSRELAENGIYRITAKGDVARVASFPTRVNGIAFSPSGDILYATDSDRRLVLAIELNGRGEVKAIRDFVAIPDAIPSGLCVDKRGSVYVAAGVIRIFDKNGAPLGTFHIPQEPSGCVFGEADGKGLFVTARGGVYRLQNPVEGLLPR
ncbi:MAG: SMP-30/gluconolactonase/LRE family protein [Bryobacterales bacterium]|nr:SMP-30/gluconolactonase/LRE family protein [Bryobacterales bacterium]